MKKFFSLLLALLMTYVLTVPVLADIIWEPDGDSFYTEHIDECTTKEGKYEIKEGTGVYKSPEAKEPWSKPAAGTSFYSTWAWEDWLLGYTESGVEGWMREEDLRRFYDDSDFYAEHQAEFEEKTGTLSYDEDNVLILWTFPGSGAIYTVYGGPDGGSDEFSYSLVYTDRDGLEWAFIPYHWQDKGWICLSDPTNEALPAYAPKYTDESDESSSAEDPEESSSEASESSSVEVSEESSEEPIEKPSEKSPIALVVGLVAAVVVVTAALLIFLRKRAK